MNSSFLTPPDRAILRNRWTTWCSSYLISSSDLGKVGHSRPSNLGDRFLNTYAQREQRIEVVVEERGWIYLARSVRLNW